MITRNVNYLHKHTLLTKDHHKNKQMLLIKDHEQIDVYACITGSIPLLVEY